MFTIEPGPQPTEDEKHVTPSQQRHVDPYEPIVTSNAINEQFSWLQEVKGIVEGLELQQVETRSFLISSGIFVVDGCVIRFPETTLVSLDQTEFYPNTENVVFIKYQYDLVQPKPYATIHVQPTSSLVVDETIIILGFLDINSSSIITSIHNESFVSDLQRDSNIIDSMIITQVLNLSNSIPIQSNLDLSGHKIINLAESPENSLDAVAKGWVDDYIAENVPVDCLVKTDELEASSTHFPEIPSINKGWFLDEEIKCDNNVIHKEVVIEAGNYKKIKLSKTNYRCRVVSGDSVLM